MGLGDGGHGGEERVVGKGVVDGRHVPSEEKVGGVATGIVVHSAHVRVRVCVCVGGGGGWTLKILHSLVTVLAH